MQEDFSRTVLAPSSPNNVWSGKKMDEFGGPWSSSLLLEVTQTTFRGLGGYRSLGTSFKDDRKVTSGVAECLRRGFVQGTIIKLNSWRRSLT